MRADTVKNDINDKGNDNYIIEYLLCMLSLRGEQ